MKKILLLTLLLLASCSLNKLVQHHGVNNLEAKQIKLKINETNKNEIIKYLGPPSTKSVFDNEFFIYIERKTSNSKIMKLGKRKLIENNVLLLEINNKGILITKNFYNKDDMNDIKFNSDTTEINYTKRTFIENALNSAIQRVNDPLGKKRIKN